MKMNVSGKAVGSLPVKVTAFAVFSVVELTDQTPSAADRDVTVITALFVPLTLSVMV